MTDRDAMRHIVHPGYVISMSDGDRHFVGFIQLCRLYGLNPSSRSVVCADRTQGMDTSNDCHHFPRQDGRYDPCLATAREVTP